MLPVLYRFSFDSELSRILAYLLVALVTIVAAWNGWRGAEGERSAVGELLPPKTSTRRNQAFLYGIVVCAIGLFGLSFAFPPSAWIPVFGHGRGVGIPLHTYGLLIGSGFASAITVSSWLAKREWEGQLGEHRRLQVLDIGFYIFLGGIIGSRELYVIVNFRDYLDDRFRAFEAYAVVVDILVLVALIIAVAGRTRFFAQASLRERILQRAFRWFMTTFVVARIAFALLGGGGLTGLGNMFGGGLVFYGGLIGAALAAAWFCLANGIQFVRLADLALPTVSLGQAFGRLGCFSAGCCWGKVTTRAQLPFAAEFPGTDAVRTLIGTHGPTPSLAFSSMSDRIHETRWVVEQTGQVLTSPLAGATPIADWVVQHGHTLPIHPTQLYESVGQLLLFVLLLTMRGYRRFHGQIVATWLICYAFLRSTVETFRGDLERGTLHGLLASSGFDGLASAIPLGAAYNISVSQFISILMAGLGVWILARNLRTMQPPFELPASAV